LPSRPHGNLKPGQAYADLPALAARLALLGDLALPQGVQGDVYQEPIINAMKKFQRRHGLPPSGILDAPTYRALTTPLSKRVLQLQLTLERWRWLRADILPAVVVNIPEFELRAFDGNHHVALKMHVIVGKAYRHRTPVFEDTLESIVIRPYWNVPGSIQKAEIVPNLRRDPGYLEKHHFQVVDPANRPQATPSRDELLARLATGGLRVRQMPGPANSLGLLKFNFPNQYNVYMHGTPQQNLFSQSRRDFSHGCIRVEDPVSLATWVLQGEGNWSRDRIVDAMNASGTVTIPVRRPITVLLLYGSAVVEETGEVHFFDDIYGHDASLERQLAHGYPYPR
jgi:L,D-transpeptidase YcbB